MSRVPSTSGPQVRLLQALEPIFPLLVHWLTYAFVFLGQSVFREFTFAKERQWYDMRHKIIRVPYTKDFMLLVSPFPVRICQYLV